MKYIVISLYDGTNTIEDDLDADAFEGMELTVGATNVWLGEECMIVEVKE